MKTWKRLLLFVLVALICVAGSSCTAKIDGFVMDNGTPIDYLPVCSVTKSEVEQYDGRNALQWAELGISGVIREGKWKNFRGQEQTEYYVVARLQDGNYFVASCQLKQGYSGDTLKNYEISSPLLFAGLEKIETAEKLRIGMSLDEVKKMFLGVDVKKVTGMDSKTYYQSVHYLEDGSVLTISFQNGEEDATVVGMSIQPMAVLAYFRGVSDRDMNCMRR